MTNFKITANSNINVIPIKIIPFPTGGNIPPVFIDNKLIVPDGNGISDKNDTNNECDYTGLYIVKSSTYKDDNKPYLAFNSSNNNSYWESADMNGNKSFEILNSPLLDDEFQFDTYKSTYNYFNFIPSYYNSNVSSNIFASSDIFKSSTIPTSIKSDNIFGEWIQIQIPNPIFLYSYCIQVPPTDSIASPLLMLQDNLYNFDSIPEPTYTPVPIKTSIPTKSAKPSKLKKSPIPTTPRPTTPRPTTIIDTDLYIKYSSNNVSYFPKIFTLAGSNDENNWYIIDEQSLVNSPELERDFNKGYCYDSDNNTIRVQVNSTNSYSYYRLIISALFAGNKSVKISYLSLYGFVRFPVQNQSTLKGNLFVSNEKNNNGSCRTNDITIDSFSTITNSQQYLSGMENKIINNYENNENNFRNDNIDPNLLNKYKDLKESINKAKNTSNYLPNLSSYDIYTKQIIENFDSHGFEYVNTTGQNNNIVGNNIINKEINPLIQINSDYVNSTQKLNQNMKDLEYKINYLNNNIIDVSNNDSFYEYNDVHFNKPPNLVDGKLTDINDYIIQQNSVLILSTITIATLVLALFLVYK
jgi:hypothetical protein